jgi:nucleoid DNA-binding protein
MAKKAGKSGSKAASKPAKITPASKQRKKSEIYTVIAEHVGISRKQVAGVFDVLGRMMAADLAKPTASQNKVFVVPGMMKVQSIYKPATRATQKPNPFKPGEMMTVKAKPARTVIKIRPLKGLKSMV